MIVSRVPYAGSVKMHLDNCRFGFRASISNFLLACFIGMTLASCSLAPAIQSNSLAYDDAIEDVSNKSLITNVLRASDNAPLYFPDLAIIRGSISASGSIQSSIPFPPGPLQIGPLAAGSNPSFDIAPTNTKQFYQGLLNPINKALFSYYLERDLAQNNFGQTFLMLVNAIEVTENGRSVIYSAYSEKKVNGKYYHPYYDIAKEWVFNDEDRPMRIAKKKAAKSGIGVVIDARSLVEAQKADLAVTKITGGIVEIAKKAPDITICAYSKAAGGYLPIDIVTNSTVKEPTGDELNPDKKVDPDACKEFGAANAKNARRYKLHLRSVEQLFYYLGEVVRTGGMLYEDGDTDVKEHVGCSTLSFHLLEEPVEKTRFSVQYRGKAYFVAPFGTDVPCRQAAKDGLIHTEPDQTLSLLVVLNDLLNLNRDANETPTTPAVTSVGSKT